MTIFKFLSSAGAFCVVSFAGFSASAQTTSVGEAVENAVKDVAGAAAQAASERIFTEEERKIIRDILGGGSGSDTPQSSREEDEGDEEDEGSKKAKKDKSKGKGKGQNKGKGKSKELPPGLAKKDGLPPGLAKRETLPPGLAKRSLPDDLDAKLGPPPEGTERVIVDNDVLLIEKGTDILLDVITDVILNAGN